MEVGCIFCFFKAPRSANGLDRAHLIHDLRPYICTYEDCKNPDQQYDNRHDWIQHENSCHRKIWRCPEHSSKAFTQLEQYQHHLHTEHPNSDSHLSEYCILRAGESVMATTDRPCPICFVALDTPKNLQSHIALHLERFALFSLPRSVACGDEEDNEGDAASAHSAKANGTIEDSRDDDFEGDIDFDSQDAGYDVEERGVTGRTIQTIENQIEAVDISATTPEKKHRNPERGMPLTEKIVRMRETETDVVETRESAGLVNDMVVCGRTTKIFEDHNSPVYMMAFSPNDSLLASVSDDKVVRFWDPRSGESRITLHGHKKGFRSVAWSHDGRIVASGSYDKTTKIWDIDSQTCIHTLLGHEGAVSGLAFSSNDRLLVSASHDKTCKIWNTSKGSLLFTLQGHTTGVFSVGISPDDKHVVSGSNDKTAKVWSLATGALVKTLKGHGRVIYALAFMPNSTILATGSNDWTIKIWDLDSGNMLHSFKSHSKGVTALAFSPDGSLLASGSYDHLVKIWNTSNWTCHDSLAGHSADVYGVIFSHKGKRLASGSRDKTVRLWDLSLVPRDGLQDQAEQAIEI